MEKNIFSDNGELSRPGLSFLAGLQKRMAECALLVATTPNAYKRRTAYSFCPVNTTWGVDNRTVGLRVIDGAEHAVRIEKRDGSDSRQLDHMPSELAMGDLRKLELVFELFPILKERQKQEASTQSGGERQMLSLSRALMSSPRLLLVDETTIGLSPIVCVDIASALLDLNRKHELTVLIAEQNANFALSLAEHIYLLETGRITRQGTSAELQQSDAVRESYFSRSDRN